MQELSSNFGSFVELSSNLFNSIHEVLSPLLSSAEGASKLIGMFV